MNSNIFVPEKINVGFQSRSDTYTKMLAYVIYFDQKGVLRKETSWNSWRDNKIESVIHENKPTSGFVLNKKVGDYVSDWNHRQAYVRVYDPRNFEFEITIENLLYILENANSIKGKGLEGEFVYGWAGKDLILIPTDSPDYIEISSYTDIVNSNLYVKTKDLIFGATYRTKNNEHYIYLGRFDYWKEKSERVEVKGSRNGWYPTYEYVYTNVNCGKHYYFVNSGESVNRYNTLKLKNIGEKFIGVVSTEPVDNYSDLISQLECTTDYSPYDSTKDEYVSYALTEFIEKVPADGNTFYFYGENLCECMVNKKYGSNDYYCQKTNRFISSFEKSHTLTASLEEIYNTHAPRYKIEYLQNGRVKKKGY